MKARQIISLSSSAPLSRAMTNRSRRIEPPSPPPSSSTTPPPQPLSLSPSSLKANYKNPNPHSTSRRSLALSFNWEPLPFSQSELFLPLNLPTGQSFRWRQTGSLQFTGVVGCHLVSLTHLDTSPSRHVAFHLHSDASIISAHSALSDYFNHGISLSNLWEQFSTIDSRFKEVLEGFDGGARIMKQDPTECVFQFLCSSNNHIKRIHKMVGVLESYGNYLGSVNDFKFYEFPSIEKLASISENELREAGFGYRAKYVVGTAKELCKKPGGGAKWLESLRELELSAVIKALCTLPGVGPKVASCIALFSLDQHHAVPVDTHVWKIATRYLMPELAGTSLTPKICDHVANEFVAKYGNYAGWAQNVLFIAELSSQKVSVVKPAKRKRAAKDIDLDSE